MADRRTILIADPDPESVRSLRAALKDEYDVLVASDGSRALQQSVLMYPDLILFYRHCPLIGATQFLRILRANPRTEGIPLIILSNERLTAEATPGFLEGVLVKPLNLDEVRSHVASVFRRVDTAKQVVEDQGAVSGGLDQISMTDLLQIFSVNRRSGALQLLAETGNQSAQVFLHDGRIEDAVIGAARGEKALYRLLSWRGGRFSFVPGSRASSVTLNRSTDALLMEGMRQGDELERMADDLPDADAILERTVPPEGLPEGLHPVTAEIFQLAEYYPRFGDLLDRAQATDLEVGTAVRSLVGAGLLRVASHRAKRADRALLSADEVLDLRSRLRRAGLAPTFLSSPRVAVVSTRAADLREFGAALTRLSEFSAGDLERLGSLPVGSLGTLALGHAMNVDFYAVSTDERLLPLTFGLTAGTVAAVVLGTGHLDEIEAALAVLERERRAALLLLRRPKEPATDTGARRHVLDVDDFSDESLRKMIGVLFKQVAGTDLRGVAL
ncbi:MAG: DUF4388 domain-containing protein [Myxococcota bacterium]